MPRDEEHRQGEMSPGMAPYVAVSIMAALGWLVFIVIWLFFWAGGLNIFQNLAVFLASILVLAAVLAPMWAYWGMKHGYKDRRGRYARRDWDRYETVERKLLKTETGPENDSEIWKKFFRRHWGFVVLVVVGAILAFVGAILVYLGFVGAAQLTGLVPTILGLWTMGHLVTFLINLIFWEALLIGVPVILAAVAGWLWWKKLPNKEKKEYRFFGKRARTSSGGGGVSAFFFVAFCIKVFIDGNWNIPIATWTLDYVVYSMLTILIWVLIIFGIPAAIGIIWWIRHGKK